MHSPLDILPIQLTGFKFLFEFVSDLFNFCILNMVMDFNNMTNEVPENKWILMYRQQNNTIQHSKMIILFEY